MNTYITASFSVLIADSLRLVRHAVGALLQKNNITAYMAAHSSEVLKIDAALKPTIILLDPRLPGLSTQELVYALNTSESAARILLFTANVELRPAKLLPTSTIGCVSKSSQPLTFLNTLREVSQATERKLHPTQQLAITLQQSYNFSPRTLMPALAQARK